jgi:hypothetical protein
MKCATWFSPDVEAVLFDGYFVDFEVFARVEIHPQHVFKILFTLNGDNVLLHTIVAVRHKSGGREVSAKWLQDDVSGAFAIYTYDGNIVAMQGGYQGHIPGNCKHNGLAWSLDFAELRIPLTRYCLA